MTIRPIGQSRLLSVIALMGMSLVLAQPAAQAGVFNIPNFISQGKNAVGIGPELNLSNDTGLALNLRYQLGISQLSNLHLITGPGGGERHFRIGAAYTFDFFPDMQGQPGIGLALQGMYYRYSGNRGQFEPTFIPYLHKEFRNNTGGSVEPFVAIPMGMEFKDGESDFIATLVLGTKFKTSNPSITYIGELGANLSETETYVSGGVVFSID
ncbi:MAG: hypothetical protein EOP09_05895 [Proteobacteria bacterium]|nr:MAG: hypothetical protein EOP09_05895 [Pseudomonadota bacterium]